MNGPGQHSSIQMNEKVELGWDLLRIELNIIKFYAFRVFACRSNNIMLHV